MGLLPELVTDLFVLEFVNLCEFHSYLKGVEFYLSGQNPLHKGVLGAFASWHGHQLQKCCFVSTGDGEKSAHQIIY